MLRKILMMAVVCLISAGAAFAQTGSLTGTVTDAKTGEPLVGANVFIPELSKGAPTDIDGSYTITDIPVGTYEVRISYIGYAEENQTVDINEGTQELDVALTAGVELGQMVVTALGEEVNRNSVTFSTQEVEAEQLNVTQNANIKTSLAGKVSGLQIVGQAGSKLGESGDIRIRGAISLTSELSEPLYVVDGVPGVDPNMIDMNNVEDVNVLKGPNATALYGQRGENGVIIISTKDAGSSGVSVELNNSLTYQQVAYLPEYQNSYGQGYGGNGDFATFNYDPTVHPTYFEPLDGARYLTTSYADESWGPKLDGEPYAPWYAWFPDSPYYGETTAWDASPNNIKNFYNTGTMNKASVAVNYAQDTYSARVSYTNLSQAGILPSSSLNKHFMSAKFDADITEAFKVGVNFNYTLQDVVGDVRSDGYGNQTSGSFNSWFARQLDVDKMQELQNLRTPSGYLTSWNWWNPDNYALGGASYQKPVFWYNSYKWMDAYYTSRDTDDLLLNVDASYQLSDNWELQGSANRSVENLNDRWEMPYEIEYSAAHDLYIGFVNSFGVDKRTWTENNYSGRLTFKDNFGDWSLDAFGGTNLRVQHYERISASMDQNNYQSGGLIIPNVFQYTNSREQIVPVEQNWDKKVFSLFGRASVGYQNMFYVNGSYRQDWSSALPNNNNGYGYPSVGASFVFSELVDSDVLSYGKIRAGWAQVGNDVGAEALLQNYVLSTNPYTNPTNEEVTPLLYTDATRVDPNIKPAINSSFEVGTEVRFLNNRIGMDVAYYSDVRQDEIIPISLSTSTGQTGFLTNAGRAERQGVELSLDVTPVQNENFQWTSTLNFAHNYTEVTDLPQDLQTYQIDLATNNAFGYVTITHEVGKEWGQLRGAGIRRNEEGLPVINDNGLYVVDQNVNFGSVLPDFTGGWLNNFNYKGFNLLAAIDFQKGGKFFSLSESWGQYSGLLEETANNNDLGNPKRDPVSEGGGVHVVGVDTEGNPVDMYVPALDYYSQWYANRLAEPFVHDKSFIKLREISLSYSLPTDLIGDFVKSARIGVVGRNLWMIALSGENKHNWDPSELSQVYGENGQLPGTRSYGVNLNITF